MKVQQKNLKKTVEIEAETMVLQKEQPLVQQEYEWIVQDKKAEQLMSKTTLQVPIFFGGVNQAMAKICEPFCIGRCEDKCLCKEGTKCGKYTPALA